VHRLEAALDRTCAQRRKSSHWTCDPLELPWSEVPQFKEIAEEPARGLGYNERVRLGNGLKACREVRCLPNDIVFLPFAGPHKVPDYHHPGGSSYPLL
jgi:hypothetical protein